MTTRGKGGVSSINYDGTTTTIHGSVKRPQREEKRPILLSLLFICFLSVVAVLARISSPPSLVFIGKSSASEDDDDDVVTAVSDEVCETDGEVFAQGSALFIVLAKD